MLKIWGRKNSANVQKVLWLAGELKLEYEHIPAGGAFGRVNDADFRALNPNGLVPVLQDGDFTLYESHAILRYLAAKHGGEKFWPADPAARARNDQWMEWSQSAFQPSFLGGVFWGYWRTPESQRNWPAIRKAQETCARQLTIAGRELAKHPYLTGDELSLADIPLGTMLFRFFELDLEWPKLPNIEAWYARLTARPTYREHVMVDFSDLKAKLA